MIRFLVTLAIVGALIWAAVTIPIGRRTLYGHIRNIWHSEQAEEMKQDVKQTAGPAVHRVERGIEAGYKAMKNDAGDSSSGSNEVSAH